MPVCVLACAASAEAAAPKRPAVPRFDHVVVIVFENKERPKVLGSGAAPTFDRLAARYAQATRYQLLWRTRACRTTWRSCPARHTASRRTATTALQVGPDDRQPADAASPQLGRLRRGLVPLRAALREETRAVPLLPRRSRACSSPAVPPLAPPGAVLRDARPLPRSTTARSPQATLGSATFIKPLLSLERTAVFIAFDEGSSDAGGGGDVALIVAGTAVKPHSRYTAPMTHYGLLRTLEDALGLPALGAAARAHPLTGIWR